MLNMNYTTDPKKGIHSYTDLIVWQKAMDLVVTMYELTEQFPKEETYGLTSQIRRCAVSIPSNIAEGRRRGTRKDYVQFLRMAYGSGAELETQVLIAKRLSKTKNLDYTFIDPLLNEVMRMLNVIIRKMNPQQSPNEAKKLITTYPVELYLPPPTADAEALVLA
jgi:four helix bundle protein